MYTVCTVCIGNLRTLRNPAKEAWGLASVATSLNASHSNYRFPTSRPAIDHPASQLAYTRLAALHAHTHTQSRARAESHIHAYMGIYIYIYTHTTHPRAYTDTKHYADTHRHTRAHPCTIPHRTTLNTAADHTARRHTHTHHTWGVQK